MKLSDKRYEQIKRIVVNMFENYHVSSVPISGFEIATQMGIKVIPYSAYNENVKKLLLKESTDGFFVELSNGEIHIYYNDSKNYGRINHTIMHEIGHIILGHTQESELAEAEVSFFAKYALAPPVLVYKLRLASPEELAKAFDISPQAAGYAYNYYEKWLKYGASNFTAYEKKILQLFEAAS